MIDKKSDLLVEWETHLQEWRVSHPAACAYAARFPKRNDADKAIGISISALRIQPHPVSFGQAGNGIANEAKGMGRRILEEIGQEIRDSFRPGGQKATQTIVKGLLNDIVDKCRSLTFVGGKIGEVASFVNEVIARMPQSGYIVGDDYLILSGALSLLEDADRVEQTNLDRYFASSSAAIPLSTGQTVSVPSSNDDQPDQSAYAW